MAILNHDDPAMTYACPCCGRGGGVYEREGNGNASDDRPFRCQSCSDTFMTVVEREAKPGFIDKDAADISKSVWQANRERVLEANGLLSHGD